MLKNLIVLILMTVVTAGVAVGQVLQFSRHPLPRLSYQPGILAMGNNIVVAYTMRTDSMGISYKDEVLIQ